MKKSTNLVAAFFAVSVFNGCSAKNETPAPGKPNILWIYIEEMNPWFGCYDDKTVLTPNMDKLARDGVLFERCYTPVPVCSHTRSSLITGKVPTTIGIHNHDGTYAKLPGYLEGNTLPEIFEKNGYQTY